MEKTKEQPRRNDALQSGAGGDLAFGQDDHESDPAIGQSKGIGSREDLELIEGENTVEGDVENDSTYGGGADPEQPGRTNK